MMLRHKLTNEMFKKGLTQTELSKKSNLPLTTVYQTLYGVTKSPSLKVVYRLCRALNISLDDLIKNTEFEEEFK